MGGWSTKEQVNMVQSNNAGIPQEDLRALRDHLSDQIVNAQRVTYTLVVVVAVLATAPILILANKLLKKQVLNIMKKTTEPA